MADREALMAEIQRRGMKTRKQQIQEELQRRGVSAPSQEQSAPEGNFWKESLEDAMIGGKNTVGSLAGGLTQILRDYSSIGPLLNSAFASQGIRPENFEQRALQRNAETAQARERSPWATFGGEMVGGAAVPIPGFAQGKTAANVWQSLGRSAGSNAAQGSIASGLNYVPEGESRTENAGWGLIASALLGPAFTGLGHSKDLINKIRPSALFDNGISEEALRANLRAAEGTETGLGNIVESPFLQAMQDDILAKLPLSGTQKTQARTGQQVRRKGNELYEDLIAGESLAGGTPGEAVQQELKDAYGSVRATKKGKYDKVNEKADELSTVETGENAAEVAAAKLAEGTATSKLANEFDPAVKADLEEYAKTEAQTLKQADLFRGRLGAKAKKYGIAGDDYVAGIYTAMKRGTEKDIEAAIDKSGSDELKGLRDEAHKYYKENFAPFKKKIFNKYINNDEANPDNLIKSFFRLGKDDNAYLAQRFTENLAHSPNFQGGMASVRKGLYQDALGKNGLVNPNKLAARFQGTGDNLMRQALKGLSNPEEIAQRMGDYQNLVRMNQKSIAPMYSPVNGYKATSVIPLATTVGGATAGFGMGGPLGALGGALLGSGLGVGQFANKALTSEAGRKNFVEKMIRNRTSEQNFNDEFSRALSSMLSKSAGAKTGKSKKEENK